MLIAALMAIMIMVAVGFFAVTMTSTDIRISSMLVGERKAFSAAEAGVHEISRLLNPFNPVAIPWTKFDNVNDPSVEYSTNLPKQGDPSSGGTSEEIIPGYDLSKAYVGSVFETTVSGRDTSYTPDVMTQITVGTVYAPNPSDTQQGQN